MRINKFDYQNAANNIRRLYPVISKDIIIYTSCDHVSKSGMSRRIKAFVVANGEIICLGYGRVSGCGMDMGFHVAETIFYAAYPGLRYQDYLTHRWL